MRLSDIMSREVRTVGATDRLDHARRALAQHHIHHLVVMDRGEIVGVVSAHDLAARRGDVVKDVMAHFPVVATAKTSLGEAANLLREEDIGCLPVVDDRDHLVGIVTISDLLAILGGKASKRPLAKSRSRRR